jgi:hypothetical protein
MKSMEHTLGRCHIYVPETLENQSYQVPGIREGSIGERCVEMHLDFEHLRRHHIPLDQIQKRNN